MSPASPAESSLSRHALAAILDALESDRAVNRRALGEAASVSPSTVARAVGYLTRAGILSVSHEPTDADAAERHAGVLSPTPAAILPVLTLGRDVGSVHALNAKLELVGAAVTELSAEQDDGERLRLLCRRAMTLLGGCAKAAALPVTAPVLLVESGETAPAGWREAITDTVGVVPLALLDEHTAVARCLRWESLPQSADSLLYLRTGESHAACLFARTDTGSWVVSPPKQTLDEALTRYLRQEDGSAKGQRRGALRFIRDLSRFIRPDVLLLEDPRRLFREEDAGRELFPDGVAVLFHETAQEGLTLPVSGAARYARRVLWERVLGLSS